MSCGKSIWISFKELRYNKSMKKTKRQNIINYVNVIVGLKVDEDGWFRWTREFEDRIVSVRDIGEKDWIIVELEDGKKYLKDTLGIPMAYPIGEWPEKKSALKIGQHPDWKAYKAAHMVGAGDEWDEEGEWNVFCKDRGLDC